MHVSREEFERLALEQLDMIDRLARAMTRNGAEAEDLVQETYVRAMRAWSRFDLREHGIRPWLIRILHNLHLNRIARESRQPSLAKDAELEAASAAESPESQTAERWEANEDLRQALTHLPPELRTALELWAVDGLTYQEMADAFEIPIGTVMSRLHRAKRLLREAYERRSRIAGRPVGSTKDEPATEGPARDTSTPL